MADMSPLLNSINLLPTRQQDQGSIFFTSSFNIFDEETYFIFVFKNLFKNSFLTFQPPDSQPNEAKTEVAAAGDADKKKD